MESILGFGLVILISFQEFAYTIFQKIIFYIIIFAF